MDELKAQVMADLFSGMVKAGEVYLAESPVEKIKSCLDRVELVAEEILFRCADAVETVLTPESETVVSETVLTE